MEIKLWGNNNLEMYLKVDELQLALTWQYE